jgi:hypothetical protein
MATQPQPLFYRGSDDLQIMTATDISNIVAQVIALHAANPAVVLTQVSSGGSLGTINDTRWSNTVIYTNRFFGYIYSSCNH